MSIPLPAKHGIIVLKSEHSLAFWRLPNGSPDFMTKAQAYVFSILRMQRHQEDENLLGLCVGMGPPDVLGLCEYMEAAGLRKTRDYVVTLENAGIVGRMPPWLNVTADGDYILNEGPPLLRAPPLPEDPMKAVWAQLALEKLESQQAAQAYAEQRWPTDDHSAVKDLLEESEFLVEFVEGSLAKGAAARRWVEQTYLDKRWAIQVAGGYNDELGTCLRQYLSSQDTAREAHLQALKCRAGEYLLALERSVGTSLVDVDCYRAWVHVGRGVPGGARLRLVASSKGA